MDRLVSDTDEGYADLGVERGLLDPIGNVEANVAADRAIEQERLAAQATVPPVPTAPPVAPVVANQATEKEKADALAASALVTANKLLANANGSVDKYERNLGEFEGNYGNASKAHKPSTGSGYTIGVGLDSIGTTRAEMLKLGIPERLLKEMDVNKVWELGKDALAFTPVEKMTKKEFKAHKRLVAEKASARASELHTQLPNLTQEGVAMLLSIEHWAGSLSSSGESKVTRYKKNLDGTGNVDKLPKAERGELVSPLKDLLSNTKAKDSDLKAALRKLKTSYDADTLGSLRSKTLTKYMAKLNTLGRS
tara:strand:+ start:62 stop:988 length:927 start_codon:yes stop_codon:yes gene_type:complete